MYNFDDPIKKRAKMKRTKMYKFAIIFIILLIIYILYKILISPRYNNYNILKSYIIKSKSFHKHNNFNNNGVKTILLWTDFFNSDKWYIDEMENDFVNETYFKSINCPITNCIITNNRNYLPSIDLYDALLFHTAEPFELNEFLPSKRNPEQLYIFAILESPAHTKHDISDEFNIYNLTMTYRLNSDIVWPYGYIEDIESKKIIAPSLNPLSQWREPIFDHIHNDVFYKNLLKTKNKQIAWFVSNCKTISNRGAITKILQKYIQVDVYGKCGSLSCTRFSQECDNLLNKNYKFYLSFENSLCEDYVTEKFFYAMKHFTIPIVYGGADYEKFAPPYSYINVENFRSVKELADYLLYLNDNPEEYLKYFWWKKYYRVVEKQLQYCKICEVLHDKTRIEKFQFYGDIKRWWFEDSCRLTPNIILE